MPPKGAKEPALPPPLQQRLDDLSQQQAVPTGVELETLRSRWRVLGNDCYANGSFMAAIRCYTRLMELPEGDSAVIRSNRSAAYIQCSMLAGPSLAAKDAEVAVSMSPTWYKGFLRLGDAQALRKKYMEAQTAYEKALLLEPTCTAAQRGLAAAQKELAAENATDTARRAEGDSGTALLHRSARVTPATIPEESTSPLTTAEKTEQLIQQWKADISVRDDRSAQRPRRVTLEEADRTAGVSYKKALLHQFRSKVEEDEALGDTIRLQREEAMLRGQNVDYVNGSTYRNQYSHATNGIGLGISTDAYRSYTGMDNKKLW